jgi:ankyrin repeat protein
MATIEEKQESREFSLKILKWLSAATRPLQFQGLQTAISIEDGDAEIDEEGFLDAKTMVDLCGGLIAIEQETGAVRFVHHTVQEYVLSNSSISSDAHLLIAKTCLTYLSLETRHRKLCDRTLARIKGWSSIDERHFWDYAACNWAFHMRTIGEPKDLSIRVLAMFGSPDLLYALARTIWWYSWDADWLEKDYQSLPLHIFAVSGLNRLVQLTLKDYSLSVDFRDFRDGILPPSRADFKDTFGQTPLALASKEGHEEVVHYLAGREDVNPGSKDGYDQTPLALAAKNGHEAVVRFLAERIGVEADSKDRFDRTPLSLAAERGHEAVVQFLAERTDVDADWKDWYGHTPLSWAAGNGHEAVVRFLAERADTVADSTDNTGWTPLLFAAAQGHMTVVRFLVERADVNVNSKDKCGKTPLSSAAETGHEAVVRFLTDWTDVDADLEDHTSKKLLPFQII